MKTPDELVSELSFSDDTTHYFYECRQIKNPLGSAAIGVYQQRLEACDSKIRFAAKAFIAIREKTRELEHGEFIYFDDASRLDVEFYAESFLIFLRASLDLAISAYYTYFTGKTDLDSIHDFIKKVGKAVESDSNIPWLPVQSRRYWNEVYTSYSADERFSWIQVLVGRTKGMALRDLALHKQNVFVDAWIDDRDKGQLVIGLTRDTMSPILPELNAIFDDVQMAIDTVIGDIVNAEQQY